MNKETFVATYNCICTNYGGKELKHPVQIEAGKTYCVSLTLCGFVTIEEEVSVESFEQTESCGQLSQAAPIKNFYQLLKVSAEADLHDINKAYKEILEAKQKQLGDIIEAYATLSRLSSRVKYDNKLLGEK
jgi:hypothetical protein